MAADVQGNLDDMKNYLASMDADALKGTSAWVGVNQLMRGAYEPIINRAHFVSGSLGGQTHSYSNGRFTYTSHVNSGLVGSEQHAYVPMTTVDIEVRRPMTVLFQWWAFPFFEPDGDSVNTTGSSKIFVYWDTVNTRIESKTGQEFVDEVIAAPGALKDGVMTDTTFRSLQSKMMGTASLRHITTPGTYSMGLATKTSKGMGKLQLVAWGVSFEGFYI